MCCAFSFVIWGCGGVGNGNVVERGCGWWVDAPEHCTCAFIYACSYVLVALICVIVHLFMFLAQCMYRTGGSSLLVATSSFWDMAFPRVSGLSLQLLGQLLQAASTEHTCTLILLRTMICLGRLAIMLFAALRCEPENGIFFGPVFWSRFCGR